jgi:hypothetical protein
MPKVVKSLPIKQPARLRRKVRQAVDQHATSASAPGRGSVTAPYKHGNELAQE